MDLAVDENVSADYTTVYVKNPHDDQVTEVLVPSSLPVDALPGNLSDVIETLKSGSAKKEEDSATFNLIHDPEAQNEQLKIELTVNDPQHAEYSQFIHYKFDLICQSCQFSAKSYATLVEHVKECINKLKTIKEVPGKTEEDIVTLQCQWCPSTQFHSITDFQMHSQCHSVSSAGNLSCCFCAQDSVATLRDTRKWAHLRSHLHKAHAINFYLQCATCDETFESHSALKEHSKIHYIQCNLCDFCAVDQNMLNVHSLCHDCDDVESFKCLLCCQGFADWQQTLSHLEAHHPGICPHRFLCVKCCRGFDSKQELMTHCEACSDVMPTESTISCVICKVDIARSSYVSHFIQCIEERAEEILAQVPPPNESDASMKLRKRTSFLCTGHALKFATRELYLRHLVQSHIQCGESVEKLIMFATTENDSNACVITVDPDALATQIDVDTTSSTSVDAQSTKCSICYKKFSTHARLLKHVSNVHSEEKQQPVQCQICSKFFKTQVRMRNHVREVHEGVKRKPKPVKAERVIHVCETCGYVTPYKDRLKNHQLSVHQGILPFKCPLCPYRTSERSDLVRHKFKHSNEKRYHCPTCSYSTNERWVLVNHCSKQHSIELPKRSRDTRGLPGSLRWQQSAQRQRRKQHVDTNTLDNTSVDNLTAHFKFDSQQQLEVDIGKEPLTFFVDPETTSPEMLMVSAEEITQ